MDGRLRHAPVGVLVVSAGGAMNGVNEVVRSRIGTAGNVVGTPFVEVFPRFVGDSLLLVFERGSITETSFEECYPELERQLGVSVTSTGNGVATYIEDVTRRKRHEWPIEKLRVKHEQTAVIGTVFSEILTELIGITSRTEIAKTIYHSFRETDIYKSV